MNYKKSFNFLKKLPAKLNSFYIKKSKLSVKVKNKSKSKKILIQSRILIEPLRSIFVH